MKTISVGEIAPEFDVTVCGVNYKVGARLKLSELRGKKVALVFYPKDSTPG